MPELLAAVGIGIAVFTATNVDDLFVLAAFFSDSRYSARQVVIGQFLGIGVLVGISLVCSLAKLVVSPTYIGLLGILPLVIGVKKLLERPSNEPDERPQGPNMFQVVAVTIANGGDNIGVYTPLFSIRPATDVGLIVSVFAAMTAVWCFAAHYLVSHHIAGASIRKYGHKLLPWVLIALGLYILAENFVWS